MTIAAGTADNASANPAPLASKIVEGSPSLAAIASAVPKRSAPRFALRRNPALILPMRPKAPALPFHQLGRRFHQG